MYLVFRVRTSIITPIILFPWSWRYRSTKSVSGSISLHVRNNFPRFCSPRRLNNITCASRWWWLERRRTRWAPCPLPRFRRWWNTYKIIKSWRKIMQEISIMYFDICVQSPLKNLTRGVQQSTKYETKWAVEELHSSISKKQESNYKLFFKKLINPIMLQNIDRWE